MRRDSQPFMVRTGAPQSHGMPQLITDAEVAAMLGVPVSTLRSWRERGAGPPAVKLSHKVVRYERAAVLAWLESRMHDSPEAA